MRPSLSRRSLLFALAAVVANASFAATAPRDERRIVMETTQDACTAFRVGDLATLERLLAPDFTLVSSTSQVQSRAETLAEVRSGDTQYTEFRNHDMTAHVYRDAATVQGITSLAGTSGGQAFAADVRFTDTLIRERGRWRIVVSHVTRIPPPAAAKP